MHVCKYISVRVTILFFLALQNTFAQDNTVGLLSFEDDLGVGGYTLIFPERQSDIFLLNKCGEIVRRWEDDPTARPGAVAYLLENGNILRSKYYADTPGSVSTSGGAGGVIELVSWENDILWTYNLDDSTQIQHHDIHFTPQGTVMMIVWQKKELDEIVANGFDTLSHSQRSILTDYILEIDPLNDSIVWEWHAWDHLIQDYDSTKANFGIIADHPERIDINYHEYTFNKTDWLHCNSIDYNPILDQVVISSKHFNEFWIIDRSTTITEATGSIGGNSNQGGNLLYRWGNPKAYQSGETSDRQLFSQHDVQWIDENDINPDYDFFGKIALYNNHIETGLSLGQILTPEFDSINFAYQKANGTFLPENFSAAFSHPDTARNYSTAASSIQIIGDGSVIMCAGRQGRIFELSPDGQVAWEYVTPLKSGNPIPQGTNLALSENFTFQAQRYLETYPAFIGKTLEPLGFIELAPNEAYCSLVSTNEPKDENSSFSIFPNPVNTLLSIENRNVNNEEINIYNSLGKLILTTKIPIGKTEINISNWSSGIYFLQNQRTSFLKKIIIQP
ncbi:MAG: aryl-sulfate sulfotransferase [Saprospiraceae bacterium]